MTSLSDTAIQLQINSMKQDAAEAAFKARHSFSSSDAFKQIFDGIDKTSAPKEDAEPVKAENPKRAERADRPAPQKAERKDDSISKAAEDDKETSEAEVKKIGAPKHDKSKVAKKDKSDKADDADDSCHSADKSADTTTDAKVDAKATVDTTVAADKSLDADVTLVVSAEAKKDGENTDAKASAETTVDSNANGNSQPQTADQQTKPDTTGIPVADLRLIPVDMQKAVHVETVPVAQLQGLDFRKSAPVHDKAAVQKTGKDSSTGSADDAFAAALDGDVKLATDAQTKDTQENAKAERAAQKEATQKHDDHIDLLQGKFSANATPPAVSDRAISLAVKATDSSAPTLNGSAGSGSPIAPKGDAATAAITGLEGLPQGRAGEPASFAAALRGTKEAQASLMVPSEQIAVSLHRMAKSGTTNYELQLHPAELGRVDIKLEINKDGLVHATVSADNQQAFDMLQKDSKALERALQQAGLQTDDSSLSFSLRDGSNQAQQQQAQTNSGNAWNKWMDKTLPDEPVQSKVLTFDVGNANGRIDLRV